MIQEGTYIEDTNGTDDPNTNPGTGTNATASGAAATETDADSGDAVSPDGSVQAPPVQELPLDVTFGILKNSRRRTILEYLRTEEDTVTVGELAEHIAAIENDVTVQQLNAQQRKRVYIGLYQCHLPKLDDTNVVDFNRDRGLVTLTEQAAPIFDYLDTAKESPSTTLPRRYFAFTALSSGLFLIAQLAGAYLVASVIVFGYIALLTGYVFQSYRAAETT